MKLANRTAIITGASRGIGYAVADAFLREGAKVALCGSRPATAEQAADRLRVLYPAAELLPFGVDMADTAAIRQLIEAVKTAWGHVDILVNNAGITAAAALTDTTDEQFEEILRVNLTGVFKCTREAAAVMREQGAGCIINTSSLVGLYGGTHQAAYAASKFGVNGLTKSSAKELGPYGIRVNAVAPGVVSTDMVAQTVSDESLARLRALTPLGRTAAPAELAGAYVYLASDDASFTTGAVLSVDGGLLL